MYNEEQKSELFAAWLDDRLSDQQRQAFERLCIEDEEFSSRVASANLLSNLSDNYVASSVPQWDKQSTFTNAQHTPWWQSPKLSLTSLACSAFAIVLTLSNVQVSVSEGTLSVGIADALNDSELNALVEQRIQAYQASNQAMFAQYVDALNQQQQESSVKLAEYLLSSSRQERREDFAELVKFINEQRSDDQVFYARQLNNLQQEIYAQNGIRANLPSLNTGASQLPNE
ncbi:hypothetical protein [Alteromonas flava]|uniref:hypothetical protein n=1 Tax=Alteromonas flava TaxID=2048003 RepID=UPI000C28D94C|nr:hypothetical protein [Alteromonas flava]